MDTHRAHHQERQIVLMQPLVAVTLCWLRCCVQAGSSLPTCTRHSNRQLPEVVVMQSVSPDDEHDALETCRELKIYEGWNFNSGNYLFTTDTK